MEKKALLRLLLILLGVSYLVFAVAVPASRISPKARELYSSQHDHLPKKDVEVEEGQGEGRMMMNMIDYTGPKANPAHDPKSPGGKP